MSCDGSDEGDWFLRFLGRFLVLNRTRWRVLLAGALVCHLVLFSVFHFATKPPFLRPTPVAHYPGFRARQHV